MTTSSAAAKHLHSANCEKTRARAFDWLRRRARGLSGAGLASFSCLLLGCGDSAKPSQGSLTGTGGLVQGDAGNGSSAKGGAGNAGGSIGNGGAASGGSSGKASTSGGASSGASGGEASTSGGASSGAGGGKASTSGGAATGPSLAGCRIFPADNAWNQDVSGFPVHARSQAFIASIGAAALVHPDFGTVWEGAPIGIPYVAVEGTQAKLSIEFLAYAAESDHEPYPIPRDAPIEGGPNSDGDRHVIIVETSNCRLYELYRAFPVAGGGWQADSGAVYDLSSNAERRLGWTSADAAGLPIFPGLVRYDEVVEKRVIEHALRFTVARSQAAIVAPARHFASSNTDPNLPPMGLRLRMKANYDASSYSDEAKVVCAALKRFGMIVADNGSNWYISGAPDPRWNDDALSDLKRIPGSAFEVVDTGPIQTY